MHKSRQFSHTHDLVFGLDIQLNSLLSFTPEKVPFSHGILNHQAFLLNLLLLFCPSELDPPAHSECTHFTLRINILMPVLQVLLVLLDNISLGHILFLLLSVALNSVHLVDHFGGEVRFFDSFSDGGLDLAF